ncbi:hypothetical protein B0H13DRAFT_2384176 [Mycena leptocephala]|nr:hypothetical protein B0H13DRAFT_2384176 [Mycena leptocephala]
MHPTVKAARSALQGLVSQNLRTVIGVPGTIYPDFGVQRINPTTQERFLDPAFEETVAHATNSILIAEVVRQVEANLARGPAFYPAGLEAKGFAFKWDRKLLFDMTKQSFRSCKTQWRQHVDAKAAQANAVNQQKNRLRDRRLTKTKQLQRAVEKFAAKYDLDPKDVMELLHEQLMSDEASGPENEDTRGLAAWKTRMAYTNGYDDVSAAALAKLNFLEVLEAPWRSDEMSNSLHELAQIAYNLLPAKDKKNIRYERMYKDDPEYKHLLADWGSYDDPVGFGTNKEMANAEAGSTDHNSDADIESNADE